MVQFIRLRGDFWVGAGFISDHRTASQLLSQREAARMVKNFVQPIILALAYGTCSSAKISCHSAGGPYVNCTLVRLGLPAGLGFGPGATVPVSASVSAPSIRPLADQRRPVPPGTNLGYLTHATTPPGRRTFAAGSSAPACAASASSGRAPRA